MNIKKALLLWLFALCIYGLFPTLSMAAQSSNQELRLDIEYAKEGKDTWAVVWLTMREDYHAYAHTIGGDTGKPTELQIEGKKKYTILYPAGELRRDVYVPSKMVRVYAGRVPLFVNLGDMKAGAHLKAKLSLLLCSVKHCMPVNSTVTLTMPKDGQGALPQLSTQVWAELWKTAKNKGTGSTTGKEEQGRFVSASSEPVSLTKTPATDQPESTMPQISGIEQAAESGWVFAPRSVQEELEVRSLGKALVLGLLAGLLLNFMPCVLPVLTLKASAMLVVGQGDLAQKLNAFRGHNLLFAAGILTQFVLLAIILGTAGLIWGQLFQSLVFVTSMLVIVFMLGLSMLGLFTLPVIDLKATHTNSPRLQAYLTGIMATLLATPCSGPLLGGVLSWAFMQPLEVLLVVFISVGFGMSIPYFVFALKPSLALLLPRPGRWMGVLERLVGFFLLGTSLYLLSILPQELHMPLLAALLLVAMGGWAWGYWGGLSAPPWRRKTLGLALAALVGSVIMYGANPPINDVTWETFDAATFRADMGKTPMLVEFTADWCPNCKFVERTVLTPKSLQRWKEQYGLKLVRVDLTRTNAEGEALLQALGSSSIPLTAIFGKGLSSSAPVVVRDIYSKETLDLGLAKALPH